jgi:hypothetical protein
MHLHVIGPLFLIDFILAVSMGLAELAVPGRWLAAVSAAGCLLAGGTLVLLALSINFGLFGFQDYLNGPFVAMSIWVEGAAVLVLGATAGRAAVALSRP